MTSQEDKLSTVNNLVFVYMEGNTKYALHCFTCQCSLQILLNIGNTQAMKTIAIWINQILACGFIRVLRTNLRNRNNNCILVLGRNKNSKGVG